MRAGTLPAPQSSGGDWVVGWRETVVTVTCMYLYIYVCCVRVCDCSSPGCYKTGVVTQLHVTRVYIHVYLLMYLYRKCSRYFCLRTPDSNSSCLAMSFSVNCTQRMKRSKGRTYVSTMGGGSNMGGVGERD